MNVVSAPLRFVSTLAFAFGVFLFSPAEAFAAAGDPTAEDVGRARESFARGMAQLGKSDHESARRSFAAAYALVPSVDILWNLAMTERKLGRHVDALVHFRAYATDANARADRKASATREHIPELFALTGHITLREAAEVDGALTPAGTIDLEPGMHTVGASALDIKAGVITSAATDEPPPATVAAPVIAPPPSPSLAVEKPVVTARRESSPSSSKTWTLAAMGGSSVLLAAGGVVFASLASADRSRAERLYSEMRGGGVSCDQAGSTCSDRESANAAADRASAAATAFFVVSGVMAGATLTTYLLWPNAKVSPIVGIGSAGVSGKF